jgi:hypothetical protein
VGVAMQHDFNNDQTAGSGLRVNFDIRELNLVCRV